MREFSPLAILLGVIIGGALAAANAFVGLKVGMTISASIPAAVMSLLIMRTLLKRGSLLESNMVQTVGSAGESCAAGMIFTLPALFIMNEDPVWLEMVIWGAIGGLLGVCFMVPLRKVLIVREHGVLPYPEGVACAEVLQSGERGGSGAKSVVWGAIVGAAYYFLAGIGAFAESGKIAIARFRTEFQVDSSPALLGVGYILGIRVAAYMLAGAILSWFILIPGVAAFGDSSMEPIAPVTDTLVRNMTPMDIWDKYIRYVGAGAVALGGLISLAKSFPTIVSSVWHVMGGLFKRGDGAGERADRDFPFPLLLIIIAGLGYAMWQFPQVKLGHMGAVAVIIFTFFFVTVSSRLVGIVGSSSNPVSGMTIATLLGTVLVYKYFVIGDLDAVTPEELTVFKVTCLSVAGIVCIGISVAGDTSQDLKTGYLVKATPWKQQTGEMIGVLTAVLVISATLLLLNKSHGFVQTAEHPHPLPAPQANIMKILTESVLGGNVPWNLLMMGAAAALIVEMLGLPALPFAVGMYLPLGLSTPIMVGGIIRWLIDRKRKESSETDPGTLTAAGLVAGKGLMGVLLAFVTVVIGWIWSDPRWTNPVTGGEEPVTPAHLLPWLWQIGTEEGGTSAMNNWGLSEAWWDGLPMIPFVLLTIWLFICARSRPKGGGGGGLHAPVPEPLPVGGPPTDTTFKPSEPDEPTPTSSGADETFGLPPIPVEDPRDAERRKEPPKPESADVPMGQLSWAPGVDEDEVSSDPDSLDDAEQAGLGHDEDRPARKAPGGDSSGEPGEARGDEASDASRWAPPVDPLAPDDSASTSGLDESSSTDEDSADDDDDPFRPNPGERF